MSVAETKKISFLLSLFSSCIFFLHLTIFLLTLIQVAKQETVDKVIDIVTRQLASEIGSVHPHSKFQDLGADSLDQVNNIYLFVIRT